MRRALCLSVLAATACLAACDLQELTSPMPVSPAPADEAPRVATVTFVISSSCRGGVLNGPVHIDVDNRYLGATAGELVARIDPGVRRFEAFTDRRVWTWGPTDVDFRAGTQRRTLNC